MGSALGDFEPANTLFLTREQPFDRLSKLVAKRK